MPAGHVDRPGSQSGHLVGGPVPTAGRETAPGAALGSVITSARALSTASPGPAAGRGEGRAAGQVEVSRSPTGPAAASRGGVVSSPARRRGECRGECCDDRRQSPLSTAGTAQFSSAVDTRRLVPRTLVVPAPWWGASAIAGSTDAGRSSSPWSLPPDGVHPLSPGARVPAGPRSPWSLPPGGVHPLSPRQRPSATKPDRLPPSVDMPRCAKRTGRRRARHTVRP